MEVVDPDEGSGRSKKVKATWAIEAGVCFLGALTALIVSAPAGVQGPSAKFRAQGQLRANAECGLELPVPTLPPQTEGCQDGAKEAE